MLPPCVDWLAFRLARLEEEIRWLKEEIRSLRPVRIGNINYKIQEMNVRELSGALHVGLSAFADEEGLKTLLDGPASDAGADEPAQPDGANEGGERG